MPDSALGNTRPDYLAVSGGALTQRQLVDHGKFKYLFTSVIIQSSLKHMRICLERSAAQAKVQNEATDLPTSSYFPTQTHPSSISSDTDLASAVHSGAGSRDGVSQRWIET